MYDLKVTFKNAILAQCYECLGFYADGMQDCENTKCSLYTYMPYRKLEPDLTWTKYHPKRVGRILRSEIEVKPPTKQQLENLRRARDRKGQ